MDAYYFFGKSPKSAAAKKKKAAKKPLTNGRENYHKFIEDFRNKPRETPWESPKASLMAAREAYREQRKATPKKDRKAAIQSFWDDLNKPENAKKRQQFLDKKHQNFLQGDEYKPCTPSVCMLKHGLRPRTQPTYDDDKPLKQPYIETDINGERTGRVARTVGEWRQLRRKQPGETTAQHQMRVFHRHVEPNSTPKPKSQTRDPRPRAQSPWAKKNRAADSRSASSDSSSSYFAYPWY